ncbi:Protein nud1 [Microbotryomycetes sp. JL221]|nr:Protein nud1 [Microbotryomycetes sp. JL221]
MEALLASPSMQQWSPDSSFNSSGSDSYESSSASPRLPGWMNVNFETAVMATPSRTRIDVDDDDSETDTSGPRETPQPPAWLTDELDEEWTVDDASDANQSHMKAVHDTDGREGRLGPTSSNDQNKQRLNDASRRSVPMTPTATFNTALSAINNTKPRVPSNLRYEYATRAHDDGDDGAAGCSFNTNASRDSMGADFDEGSVVVNTLSNEATSSAGTFVIRSNPSTSDSNQGQLQAAIKALKGPGAGLGADLKDSGVEISMTSGPNQQQDKLGGLLNLFDPPPSPPAGTSNAQVPTASAFTFVAPLSTPRRSWKSLEHFSPEDDSTTPTANLRSTATTVQGTPLDRNDATPIRQVAPSAPSLRGRDRFLHRVRPLQPDSALPEVREDNSDNDLNGRSTSCRNEEESTPRARPPLSQQKQQTERSDDSNFHSTLPPLAQSTGPSMPPLKLFEFQYDTFTRDHLAALVNEIDELGHSGIATVSELRAEPKEADTIWETSFVDVLPPLVGEEEDEGPTGDVSRDSAEAARSVKRIRLSPPALSTLTDARSAPCIRRTGRRLSSSRRRSVERRSPAANGFRTSLGTSASARKFRHASMSPAHQSLADTKSTVHHHHLSTRQRLDSANALLDRIREKKLERDQARRAAQQDLESASLDDEDNVSEHNGTTQMLRSTRDRQLQLQEVPETGSLVRSISRPSPLPHLAATASAMIRSQLAESLSPTPSKFSHSRQLSEPVMTSAQRRTTFDAARATELPLSESTHAQGTSIRSRPQHIRHSSLTTIGPDDVGDLLAEAKSRGDMLFDRTRGRWIEIAARQSFSEPQSTQARSLETVPEQPAQESKDLDDGFDNSTASGETRIAEARADANGLSGLGITAGTPKSTKFAAQYRSPQVVVSPPDACYFEPHRLPSGEMQAAEGRQAQEDDTWGDINFKTRTQNPSDREASEMFAPNLPPQSTPASATVASKSAARPLPTTPEGLKDLAQPGRPRSVLKTRSSDRGSSCLATPANQSSDLRAKEPRSVSFSDGRRTGKIVGLVVGRGALPTLTTASSRASGLRNEVSRISEGAHGLVAVGQPGSLEMDGEGEDNEHDEDLVHNLNEASPSLKVSARSKSLRRELGSFDGSTTGHSFDSQRRHDMLAIANQSSNQTFRRTTASDATFMTDGSFRVSTERLVKQITDVEPFEPRWDSLKSIDLAGKGTDSLVRMKDFLPNLDHANFNDNQIAFLTGVPSTVRTLLVASNRLTSVTSFAHMSHLERIDISDNQLDSLQQLSCLRHLRELKADRNRITDLSGLHEIDSLVRLSLAGNQIQELDLTACNWSQLELLNLERNQIASIKSIERLQNLSLLNLDHNDIVTIEPAATMPRLRVLRVCDNPIKTLDIAFAPQLRTLYVDSARLGAVYGTDTLRKLENFSIRDQSGTALTLAMRDVRDVRRLYLSGNPLPTSFPSEQFFNLVYLELAMCQIMNLPPALASIIPNVRVLNLDYNFFDDLSALRGLTRLTSLSVVGARLDKVRPVVDVLGTMLELESCDLRMNPLTLSFYPPFISPPTVVLPCHAEHQIVHPDAERVVRSKEPHEWPAIDKKFRRTLPDLYFFKRASYRAVVLDAVPSLLQLDGLHLDKERPKLAKVIDKLVARGL